MVSRICCHLFFLPCSSQDHGKSNLKKLLGKGGERNVCQWVGVRMAPVGAGLGEAMLTKVYKEVADRVVEAQCMVVHGTEMVEELQ